MPGLGGEHAEQVADRGRGGVVAGDQQSRGRARPLRSKVSFSMVAVGVRHFGVDHVGDHVLARLRLALPHLADQVVLQVADLPGIREHRLARSASRPICAVTATDQREIWSSMPAVEPELLDDHADRQRDGDVLHRVGTRLAPGDARRSGRRTTADARLQFLDPVRGEGVLHQLADARVVGRVRHDRVGEIAAAVLAQVLAELVLQPARLRNRGSRCGPRT